jgi:hypothetical protein
MVQSRVRFAPYIHTLVATTASKGFFAFKSPTANTVCCIVLYNTEYIFSPLQNKNKPCEGVTKPVLFLVLLA